MADDPPPHFPNPDTAMRLRFWVGGRLRDEVWMDAADPEHHELAERVGTYHARLAELADAAGVPWLVEAYHPAMPEAQAYMRYGTDAEGMIDPVPPPREPHHSGPLRVLADDDGAWQAGPRRRNPKGR